MVGLRHGEMLRCGELQDHEVTPWFQHPIHLGDALLYAFKIADAERRSDGVKTVILVGQGGAVLPLEGDMG